MADTAATREPTTSHKRLRSWVEEVAAITQPDEVHWCDGSSEEYEWLVHTLVQAGTVSYEDAAARSLYTKDIETRPRLRASVAR